jgi:hypothetical protein
MEALVSVDHEIAAWQVACARGVPFAFRGLGTSMWPALRAGDEALFAPLAHAPRPGDVLLYRAGERLVAHRFLGLRPDGALRLRGDFLVQDDPPVPRAAVLGCLVGVRRDGRALRVDDGVLGVFARVLPRLHAGAPRTATALQHGARLAVRVVARLTPRALRR